MIFRGVHLQLFAGVILGASLLSACNPDQLGDAYLFDADINGDGIINEIGEENKWFPLNVGNQWEFLVFQVLFDECRDPQEGPEIWQSPDQRFSGSAVRHFGFLDDSTTGFRVNWEVMEEVKKGDVRGWRVEQKLPNERIANCRGTVVGDDCVDNFYFVVLGERITDADAKDVEKSFPSEVAFGDPTDPDSLGTTLQKRGNNDAVLYQISKADYDKLNAAELTRINRNHFTRNVSPPAQFQRWERVRMPLPQVATNAPGFYEEVSKNWWRYTPGAAKYLFDPKRDESAGVSGWKNIELDFLSEFLSEAKFVQNISENVTEEFSVGEFLFDLDGGFRQGPPPPNELEILAAGIRSDVSARGNFDFEAWNLLRLGWGPLLFDICLDSNGMISTGADCSPRLFNGKPCGIAFAAALNVNTPATRPLARFEVAEVDRVDPSGRVLPRGILFNDLSLGRTSQIIGRDWTFGDTSDSVTQFGDDARVPTQEHIYGELVGKPDLILDDDEGPPFEEPGLFMPRLRIQSVAGFDVFPTLKANDGKPKFFDGANYVLVNESGREVLRPVEEVLGYPPSIRYDGALDDVDRAFIEVTEMPVADLRFVGPQDTLDVDDNHPAEARQAPRPISFATSSNPKNDYPEGKAPGELNTGLSPNSEIPRYPLTRASFEFGQGIPTQTFGAPVSYQQRTAPVSFEEPGCHTVTLEIANAVAPNGGVTDSKQVEVVPASVISVFSIAATDPPARIVPRTVTFDSEGSTRTATYCNEYQAIHTYDFGDGTPELSVSTNDDNTLTTHTYTVDGCYDVTLRVDVSNVAHGALPFMLTTEPNFIEVTRVPAVQFNVLEEAAIARQAPRTVTFNNETETNLTFCDNYSATYLWDFGNGETSELEDPAPVVYVEPGCYTVSLTATWRNNSTGELLATRETSQLLEVTEAPTAAFEAEPTTVNEVLAPGDVATPGQETEFVIFTDLSQQNNADACPDTDYGINRWLWDFGDGNTLEYGRDDIPEAISHGYDEPGSYEVFLTVESEVDTHTTVDPVVITVLDITQPVVRTQDIVVQLDENGEASIVPADVDNGSSDNSDDPGALDFALDITSFDCSDVNNPVTVTLTVTDTSGNVSSNTAVVTVEDNVTPIALTQDITVQLDVNGEASITPAQIDNGSNDACGVASLTLDVDSFDCSNVGVNVVTLTVTDVNGNASSNTATVTVEDNINPVALTQDITVQLNANGEASITPAQVDNGSNDACGIASLALDIDSFGCSDVGTNVVTLTVTDVNGNVSSNTAVVTVEDNVAPVVLTQNLTIQLDVNGEASITPAQINNGSNDACGIASLALDVDSFDCSDVGANVVTLTVTDVNGNVASNTATVTVEDNVNPVALTQDITVQLDVNGEASITPAQIDNGSNDACGIASLALDIDSFDCGDVGANIVTLTVTDVNGNVSSNTATVTVEDNVDPVVLTQDITVQLDVNGEASITPDQIDNGSNDACGSELSLDIDTFDCSDVNNPVTVTLTVTDVHGNIASETALVTVEDNVAPEVLTQDITVQLDANGEVSITPAQIDNGSNDACGIATLALDIDSFDCSDVGANVVNLTVTDVNGNVASNAATVTVEDNVNPIALTQDITVQLDANGEASITPAQIDNGSNDACGIATLALDIDTFDCSDVNNPVTVTLTVTDVNGNVAFDTATVTVEDNVDPVVLTQDITVQLDANGEVSITPAQIDNGSSDACGIATLVLDIDSFDCSDVNNPVTVTLTVTDVNGNVASETAEVTVEDNVDPVVLTQDITVQLDANGEASITPAQINNDSNDACGIASLVLDIDSFDCSDVGVNIVTLTVTDVNGNVASETAEVTVEDSVDPVALTQDITVQLDVNGVASITPDQIDNGSNDACDIDLSLDIDSFDCGDIGVNIVTLTVTDVNGNVAFDTATVTVEDNVDPVVLTQDITVQLDVNGEASITSAQIDNGSFDACGIASLVLDIDSFDCGDIGVNIVTLTVTDVNGNVASETATVTVEDNVEPVVLTQDITVQLDVNGEASITPAQIDNGSSDACGIATVVLDIDSFDCSDVGANIVTLTVTDVNGNVASETAVVTVEDNVDPVVLTQDITVQLDVNGEASITPALVDNGSSDACGIATVVLDIDSFDCIDVGANIVTLTVTDVNGNVAFDTAIVTVEDADFPCP